MEKKSLGLVGIILISKLIFGGCATKKESIIKQEDFPPIKDLLNPIYSNYVNLKQETDKKEYGDYPLEGGKIILKIEGGEGWKNFKNALDLYTSSENKVKLSDREIYEFVHPYNKGEDDNFGALECLELRRRARELYNKSIFKDKKINERNIHKVEPGIPYSGYLSY